MDLSHPWSIVSRSSGSSTPTLDRVIRALKRTSHLLLASALKRPSSFGVPLCISRQKSPRLTGGLFIQCSRLWRVGVRGLFLFLLELLSSVPALPFRPANRRRRAL